MHEAERYFTGNRELLLDTAGPDADAVKHSLDGLVRNAQMHIVGDRSIAMHLQDVHLRGLDRVPRRTHALVHPHWPWSEFHADLRRSLAGLLARHIDADAAGDVSDTMFEHDRQAFQARIDAVLAGTEPFIVVEPSTGRPLTPHFAYGQSAAAPSERHGTDQALESGYVSPRGLLLGAGALEGWHPEDTMRVHGAAYGVCTEEFALQQAMARMLGVFYSGARSGVARKGEAVKNALLRSPLLPGSGIRMGALFDSEALAIDGQHGQAPELHDGETSVFPGRPEQILRRLVA